MNDKPALALVLALALAPTCGFAEQRALLVGVGKYQDSDLDLPGIDLDLERMRDTLGRLGFQPQQIKTLQDDQATSANVIEAFQTWLKQGVRAEDRVVFYYSGHGSNVPDMDGDEADKVDEVLVTNDVRRTRVKGRASLTGVVVDDKLGELIDAIPSKNIWIIVDACHSGTISRSFSMENRSLAREPVFVKSYSYPGMPVGNKSDFARDIASKRPQNFVSLTAASDREKAIGTMKGGVFTIGLTETIARAAAEGKPITVNELRERTTQYIAEKVDKSEVHHPQVGGSEALAQSTLKIAQAGGDGPNRKRLLQLAASQSQRLEVKASQAKYAVGEPVVLTFTIPTAGYLNVVTVDAKDNATVLFPNHYHDNNAVKPGTLTVPTPQMDFDLLASEPLGDTLVVAFLSSDPINFFQETIDDRDANGNITVKFTTLSHTATRAIQIAPRKKETYAGQVQTEVVAAKAN